MRRLRILHSTTYSFPQPVQIAAHELRLRPREDHGLHIESSTLNINPLATLRWHRDVEDNSVAIASFIMIADHLRIDSEVVIQQFDEEPLDFLVADYAENHPFSYPLAEQAVLAPYLAYVVEGNPDPVQQWLARIWQSGQRIQTYELLQRLLVQIHQTLTYRLREEPGVQSPAQTLATGTGSCRDFAALFMAAARRLGLASRFVSGYLHVPSTAAAGGATHAWAEVYLPGAGWKGFDPTIGEIAGSKHIAVAVSRLPESVPPVAGSYIGPPGARLDVSVSVSEL